MGKKSYIPKKTQVWKMSTENSGKKSILSFLLEGCGELALGRSPGLPQAGDRGKFRKKLEGQSNEWKKSDFMPGNQTRNT